MKLVHFLNSISTPEVNAMSLQYSIGKKNSLRNMMSSLSSKQKIQNNKPQIIKKIQESYLQTHAPFYIDKRTKPQYKPSTSCHNKNSNPYQTPQNSLYLKRNQGKNNNEKRRKKIGIQKRTFIRNYQRYTYQPPKPYANQQQKHIIRKQYAQAERQHKFCKMFSIKCKLCKCKLDCINHKFQQFLKTNDLCILKGLSKIVGRGVNLDSQIKAQIIDVYLSNKDKLTVQQLIQKIVENKLGKNVIKKYLCWSKDMIRLISHVQNKKIKKNKSNGFLDKILDISLNQNSTHKDFNKNKHNKNIIQSYLQKKQRIIQFNILKRNGKTLPNNINPGQQNNGDISNPFSISGNRAQIHKFVPQEERVRISSLRQTKKSEESFQSNKIRKNSQNILKYKIKKFLLKKPRDYTKSLQFIKKGNKSMNKQINEQLSTFYKINQFDQVKRNSQFQSFENFSFNSITQKSYSKKQNNSQCQQLLSKFLLSHKQIRKRTPQKSQKSFKDILNQIENSLQSRISTKQELQNKRITQTFHHLPKKVRQSKIKNINEFLVLIQNKNNILSQNVDKKLNIYKSSQKIVKSKRKYIKNYLKTNKSTFKLQQSILKEQIHQNTTSISNQQQQRVKQLKKQVQQFSNLIQRVQEKLRKVGLQSCIIKIKDCLLTQKRKIRIIRDYLRKGIIIDTQSQIDRYLQIFSPKLINQKFTQNSLIQKQQNKNQQAQLSAQELSKLCKVQNDNLKFYQLKQHFFMQPIKPADRKIIQKINEPIVQQKTINFNVEQCARNRHLIGGFQYSISLKQRNPFDYYYYLNIDNKSILLKNCNSKSQQLQNSLISNKIDQEIQQKQLSSYKQGIYGI